MKPKSLSGIGAMFAALLIIGAIFVPAVSATTSKNVQDSTADEITLGMIDRGGDEFLDCRGWLVKETNRIRYGGYAESSYAAGYMHVACKLYNAGTGEKMSHTANSAQRVAYLEPQENLEYYPPSGNYYVHTEANTLYPEHYATHDTPWLYY